MRTADTLHCACTAFSLLLLWEHTFPQKASKLPPFQMPTKLAPNEAHNIRLAQFSQ